MDETEYEDGETEGALGAASFGSPEEFYSAYNAAITAREQAARAETLSRQKAFEQARSYIENNSYGRPTQSEQLMRLSQALLSPRRSRNFGGTLANVVPALAENQQLARRADEQRAEALIRLQQEYATGNAAATTATAQARLDALQPLAAGFRQPAPYRGISPTTGDVIVQGQPTRTTEMRSVNGVPTYVYNIPRTGQRAILVDGNFFDVDTQAFIEPYAGGN